MAGSPSPVSWAADFLDAQVGDHRIVIPVETSRMRTHVSFQKASQNLSGDDLPLGRDVAEDLVRSLKQQGMAAIARDELDYAFSFRYQVDRQVFRVMIGLVDDGVRQWLVSTDSTIGWFGRLLGLKDGEEHLELVKAIDEILWSDPGVSSVRWYTQDDWNAAAEENWVESPTE